MPHRIEIYTKVNDTRSQKLLENLRAQGFPITKTLLADIYTINKDFHATDLDTVAALLTNPVAQTCLIDDYQKGFDFDYALEIGFLPGVTDNIAAIAKESIEDLFKKKFADEESVHSSQLIFLKGDLTENHLHEIASALSNNLIQRTHIKSHERFAAEHGMDTVVPKVKLKSHGQKTVVNLNIPEEELLKLGKEGILNEDGTRRGPLALDKDYLLAIKDYFQKEGRNPTDVELESLAQTWSEHCKHTIFAAEMDEIGEGLYRGLIKKATKEIDADFCVSVFNDNSGGILFDKKWVITDKVETHNSPSALDPFGGAITGIVGVNRDCIGFGRGAKPVINKYGFCVGLPDDKEQVYRDKELKNPALLPKRVLEGVVAGINAGGNCSGIPTPQGFVNFHKNYKGKPLVFAGTIGLIPKEINGQPSWTKKARKGDLVVMLGGRVGQDGIHGATFSSEALTSGSPATAVQIGDPITQKKLSDAIVKEARALDLYDSITDCGAGGISCAVPEMAKECGGCEVDLERVPTKYPHLDPWEIWISESQERMVLAIPPEKFEKFKELLNRRGVEVTAIGTFSDSGRCIVKFNSETIMDLDLNFLHDGLPKKTLTTTYEKIRHKEPRFPEPADLTDILHRMLTRPNLSSFEFISHQYDHEVQGGAVLKPLQGKGKVNSNTSVTKPFPESTRGIVCSQALHPRYSEIDTYHMAACSIDEAIRNVIAAGGNLKHLALLDNFCWCSSNEPHRLGQLKATAQACYDYATTYRTPFISGKDSMFNDFKGFDNNGNPIKISVPPTLLISATSVMKDVTKAVSLDPKAAGDLVYILGETKDELGGSEYFDQFGFIGNKIPKVKARKALRLYKKVQKAIDNHLLASAISVTAGGIAIALAKMAIAGQLGMEIDLRKIPHKATLSRNDFLLFSESQSRLIVTVAPQNKASFEELFAKLPHAEIGEIKSDKNFVIKGIIKTNVQTLDEHYRQTFKGY
ncbi:MAG: AIR synthase-related protein [Candidatus Gracilibacteria bacterium]